MTTKDYRRGKAFSLVNQAIVLLELNEDDSDGQEEPGRAYLEFATRAMEDGKVKVDHDPEDYVATAKTTRKKAARG